MLHRRQMISMMAVSSAASAVSPTSAGAQSASKTFVLIHGAWHGGWCWKRLADFMRADGHRVYTPTLTGLGERSHLLNASINLETHIRDIVNVFNFEELSDVTLVAHSYGGWPAAGALEHVGPQVSSVIFLDAFMPENGEKGIDQNSPESIAGIKAAIERGDVSRKGPAAAAFGVLPENQAWVDAKMTPQPIGVSLTPIVLTGARERVARKAYIRAGQYKQPSFDRYLAQRQADPQWRTTTIDSGHDVMVDHPAALYDLIKSLG
jgi:pimeloyl-ACP methyl ester carboxylesterase